MKQNIQYLLLAMACILLLACGDDSANTSAPNNDVQSSAPTAASTSSEPAAAAASNTNTGAATASVATTKDTMTLGKEVYMRNCVACHQPSGKGIPPAFPSIANSAVVTGDLNAQISLVLNGVTGSAMVAFGPQLSDEEIAAVVTYQRNSFGNNTGDEATAEQVKAQR